MACSAVIIKRVVLWVVLWAAGAAAPVLAQAAPPAILVFGDSISAGYGMRASESWVALLQKKLLAEEYGWRVVNASVSGETTAGGRARLPRALDLHRPAVLVLELGANDGLRGLPPEEVRGNLSAMIEAGREAGAAIVLIGLPLPVNYGPLYTGRFRAVFADLAAHYDVPLVSFLLDDAPDASLLQDDGLHPTAGAQPLLLSRIWPVLHQAMQASPGDAP